ncbi:MAG: hypothetical protein C5B52_08730 [Bacteroidetes bacterium]|nr:MAG: hypothetical protein C5B52_08730 [Bacteroidota bacterium]
MDDQLEITKSITEQFELSCPERLSMEELEQQLSLKINWLIQNNFEHLVFILYRIDVNESKLRLLLNQFSGEDSGKIIANLIIERQTQKILTRREFKQQHDIDENEKW